MQKDSDIGVRRKVAFLLNTLLMPTSAAEPTSSSSSGRIHIPGSVEAPVHPNSHASMVADPASVSTTGLTVAAMQCESNTEGSSLLDAVVSALVYPVPFGADGECETDEELQENLVRCVALCWLAGKKKKTTSCLA